MSLLREKYFLRKKSTTKKTQNLSEKKKMKKTVFENVYNSMNLKIFFHPLFYNSILLTNYPKFNLIFYLGLFYHDIDNILMKKATVQVVKHPLL